MDFALSALEVAATERGRTAADALDAVAQVARRVDDLGFRRLWFAEHHGSVMAASVVPAVLTAHYAALTSRVRVGSGGVMAPNHAPLALAEQFATLAALHPGRIDLGIGRGPGTHNQALVRELRRGADPATDEEYRADVHALLAHLAGEGARLLPGAKTGADGLQPWLLSSSTAGAGLAADLGLPIAFAHHIRPDQTTVALDRYRERFTPSRWADRPYVIVAVETICADSDEAAARLGRPIDLAKVSLLTGRGEAELLPPAEAERQTIPEEVRGMVAMHGAAQARGGPRTVAGRLTEIAADTAADELMLVSSVYDPAARVRSYELAAATLT